MRLKEKYNELSEGLKLMLVRKNWRFIQYIEEPTETVKLEAIKQNWRASEYLHPLSENLKLAIARSKKKEESI